ncbi:MAG TPA: YceI family protein [Nannocystaceae bacterium]|nr:YceI family protein [Nannocystaceae bacterium]
MASTWNIDPSHSSVGFAVRHLMVSKVRGRFVDWRGTFGYDENDPTKTSVDIEIDAATIETKDDKRDAHLRSADFLDAEHHPKLTFRSNGVKRIDEENFEMVGDLTIRGVTRPVALAVEYAGRTKDPWGGDRIGFSAHTSISRKEFGLEWNVALEAGGVLVGDKVEIQIELEAIRAA